MTFLGTYVRTYICMYVCMYDVCIYKCMCLCVYMCVCYVCMCIYLFRMFISVRVYVVHVQEERSYIYICLAESVTSSSRIFMSSSLTCDVIRVIRVSPRPLGRTGPGLHIHPRDHIRLPRRKGNTLLPNTTHSKTLTFRETLWVALYHNNSSNDFICLG